MLAANPVNGCIEMRSSVLAGFEGVPIPEGAAAVVAGEFAKGEGRRVVPLRREREQGRGGTQRQSEIDDTQAAGVEFFDQAKKDFRQNDLPETLNKDYAENGEKIKRDGISEILAAGIGCSGGTGNGFREG